LSVFVDTGVIVGARNVRDERHRRAQELVEEIQEGEHGAAYTSDYVFDEAVSLALRRTGRDDIARRVGELVLPEDRAELWIDLLRVSDEEFAGAWGRFRRHGKAGLSFTDWTIVEMAEGRRIDSVASFDSGLDAWVTRLS
jgi:hypothetical protein